MFSVIIPAKNEASHIGLLIKDIRSQTLKPSEIIVASSSTDNTNGIASSLGAIVTPGTVDGRIGKARNIGAAQARGDILVFLDSDVRLPDEHTFALLIGHFKKHRMEMANSFIIPNSEKKIYQNLFDSYNMLLKVESKLNVIVSAPGICLLINRKLFEEIGGFNEKLKNSEDIEIIRRILKLGHRYNVIPYRVTTSVRRFENKDAKQLALLFLTALTFPVMLNLRWEFLKKYLKILEEHYGNTGGSA